MGAAAVSFRGITKRFGTILANDGIDLDVAAGTVHALLGENGAGKTTLLSILAGFLRADRGDIEVFGRPLAQGSPREALRRGVGICAQHFLLAGALTGAENILLGRPGCRGIGRIPGARTAALERLARENGLDVSLDRPIRDLSVAEQERIEILKLLERDCRILVLDEPTSVLAPPEIGPLFETLRRLASRGRTILLVTHRLAEVSAVADRVTVLRRGRVAGETDPRSVDRETLVRWIAGEDLPPPIRRLPRLRGEAVLEIRGLSCGTGPGAPVRIDLDLCAGEIAGIGGVLGNGQTEIVQALTGQIPLAAGEVAMLGRRWRAPGRVALPPEIAWVPEDRRNEGLALEMTCEENLRLGIPREEARRGAAAAALLAAFDVRPPDPSRIVAQLSGGNQQRLLLAREMSRGSRLLLAVQPTRGLDPGATAFVHARLLEARARGLAVLLVTGDLAELTTLADRVAILFRGRIAYAARAEEIDAEALNRALVGVTAG